MEWGKREGEARVEGSEVVCSVKVWYHVYASPVHPEMCDNWLLKAYSNFITIWEACCVHVQHEMDNQECVV